MTSIIAFIIYASMQHRFVGITEFAPGKWIGVELLDPRGKNNGSVNGKEYFKCADNYGLFLRSGQIQVRGFYLCV